MNDPLWMPWPGPADLAKRAMERCRALGRFSKSDTGITRTFLSPPMPDGTYSRGRAAETAMAEKLNR